MGAGYNTRYRLTEMIGTLPHLPEPPVAQPLLAAELGLFAFEAVGVLLLSQNTTTRLRKW